MTESERDLNPKDTSNSSKCGSSEAGEKNSKPHTIKKSRNHAIDFAKGALVLLMVLYHWLNYFVGIEGFVYRYIRFITPSFVFLAGFLATYLMSLPQKSKSSNPGKRLILRGSKLLLVFTALNIIVMLIAPNDSYGRSRTLSSFLNNIGSIYTTGSSSIAAFWVLVPISYTLIIAGAFTNFQDRLRISLTIPTGILFIAAIVTSILGYKIPMVELLSLGLLGLIVGTALANRIQNLSSWWWFLMIAYPIHIVAITNFGAIYALQLIATCVNLWLLYLIAIKLRPTSSICRMMSLLGQYTLLGYVSQIALLQIIHLAFKKVNLGSIEIYVALFAGLASTIIVIKLTDILRHYSKAADKIYRLVFT